MIVLDSIIREIKKNLFLTKNKNSLFDQSSITITILIFFSNSDRNNFNTSYMQL